MSNLRRFERHAPRAGLTFGVDEYSGTGVPLVLLHGIPGSRLTWRRVAEALGPGYRVIAPDLLGFGASSDLPPDFHALGQAAAVLELLEHLRLPAVHLVGFDFGGPVAVAACRLAPERVSSLTLVATNVFTDTPIPPPLQAARLPVLGDALFAAMCSWPGLASLWIPAVGDKRALSWRAFLRDIPDRRGRASTRRIFLDSLRHLRARYADIEATLPTVRCRTTVVWGDADPFFPVRVGERTAQSIDGARFHVLRGCGHFVPGERPQELAAAIAETVRAAAVSSAPRR